MPPYCYSSECSEVWTLQPLALVAYNAMQHYCINFKYIFNSFYKVPIVYIVLYLSTDAQHTLLSFFDSLADLCQTSSAWNIFPNSFGYFSSKIIFKN